jgi:hypothetical protein
MVCLAAETTWIGQKVNVIAGAMGEIMINKRDVKQGKVLILSVTTQ